MVVDNCSDSASIKDKHKGVVNISVIVYYW